MAGYVSAVPAFVCGKLPARMASSFCDIEELTSCDFTGFFGFCFVLQMWIVANLCSNTINFEAVNFSDCRSEEGISLFWRSVYLFGIMYTYGFLLIYTRSLQKK